VSVQIATNCRIYVGQYDVSGDLNKVDLGNGGSDLNAAVFTNTAGNTVPGLYKPKFNATGLVTLGTGLVHENLRGNLGVADVPVTVSPQSGAAGDVAVFLKAIESTYTVGAKVGEILPFTVMANGRGVPAIAGNLFVAAGNKTATGSSGIIQLGAVSATQKVYAAVHVLSVSGTNPTLDITVKSAALVGFGSPTTRITVAQKTAAGSDFQSASGAITDQFYRVDYTIGGTATPTFSFVVAVGIF
jgi:hypothetical protein